MNVVFVENVVGAHLIVMEVIVVEVGEVRSSKAVFRTELCLLQVPSMLEMPVVVFGESVESQFRHRKLCQRSAYGLVLIDSGLILIKGERDIQLAVGKRECSFATAEYP